MRFLSFALLALVPSVICDTPIPYKNCGKAGDLLTINSVSANVWPPVKGSEFDVSFSGNLAQDINNGNYNLKVTFDFLPIINKSGPFSDFNVTLPIKGGPINIKQGLTFPASIPSGSVDITVSATNENNAEIACFELSTTIKEPTPFTNIVKEHHQKKNHHNKHHNTHPEPIMRMPSDYMIDSSIPLLGNTDVPFTSCASGDSVTVNSIAADVWPPQKGKDITLFISATASKTVNNGNYEAAVSWDGIQVIDDKGTLASLGLTLPISAGPILAKKTLNVPSLTPSGSIAIKATATDDTNAQLFCVNINTKI